MVAPLRHRQTKEAETDMFDLQPPRHISTLHKVCVPASPRLCLLSNEDLNRFEALGLRIIDRSSPLTQPRLTRSNLLS
jgi:hypothetical protein